LPARAKAKRWPVKQPFEIAHLVFDPLLGGDYEKMVPEPIFQNFPAKKVSLALTAALGLMKCDRARIVELVEICRAFRA
jgi:hypothetical protein